MTGDAETTTRPISRRKRVVFRVVTLLLVYGIIELAAWQMSRVAPPPKRVSWALKTIRAGGNPFRYVSHPYAFFMPQPEYAGWEGVRQHSRLGWRGDEIAVPKPSNVFRVVCLGGSTTYSTAVTDPGESFPAQLEAYLRRETGNQAIEVVNAGFPGATSADVLQTVVFRVWAIEPDLLLIHTGINDSFALFAEGHALDYSHGRERFVLPRYSGWTRLLLRSPTYRLVFARTSLPFEMFWGFPVRIEDEPSEIPEPTAYRANLETLVLLAQGRGVRPYLVNEQLLPDSKYGRSHGFVLARLRAVSAELGERLRVPVCRYEEFRCPQDQWVDDMHLHAAGLREKAAFVGRDLIAQGLIPAGRADSRFRAPDGPH